MSPVPGRDAADQGFVLVYTTFPALVEAEKVGRWLVEQRLAACVNILPGMISHYCWEGAIERGEEVVMFVKTRAALAEGVSAAIKERHSYATPAVIVLPILGGAADYLAWIAREASGTAA